MSDEEVLTVTVHNPVALPFTIDSVRSDPLSGVLMGIVREQMKIGYHQPVARIGNGWDSGYTGWFEYDGRIFYKFSSSAPSEPNHIVEYVAE